MGFSVGTANCGLSADNRFAQKLVGKRQMPQASLEVDEHRRIKMPFSGNYHSFHFSTLKGLTNAGRCTGSSGYRRREIERLNGLDGLGFVDSNVEDGIQFRDLHQVVDLIRECEQLQFSVLLSCCG